MSPADANTIKGLISDMETLVHSLRAAGAVVMHLGSSSSLVQGAELSWVGTGIAEQADELKEIWKEAFEISHR